MKFFYFFSICLLISYDESQAQCTTNMLTNPSFETPVQASIGNNITSLSTISGWTITPTANFNLVKTNGTVYAGGPNNANQGTQYVDVASNSGNLNQSFALPCTSTLTFSGYFSSRESAGSYVNWTGSIKIINSSNVTVATSNTRNFVNADGAEDQIWYALTGTVSLAAGNYTFQAVLGDYGNFDNAFLCSSNCPLPVKLSSFDVKEKDCELILSWEAQSEENLKEYGIERSSDGIHFNSIGSSVPNEGVNKKYSFTYPAPEGITYYRLKMTDMDQSFEYSRIVSASKNCQKSEAVLYPNPVEDQLTIFIPEERYKGPVFLYLYDTLGELILKKEFDSNMQTIHTKDLACGVYYLSLHYNAQFKSYKVIK